MPARRMINRKAPNFVRKSLRVFTIPKPVLLKMAERLNEKVIQQSKPPTCENLKPWTIEQLEKVRRWCLLRGEIRMAYKLKKTVNMALIKYIIHVMPTGRGGLWNLFARYKTEERMGEWRRVHNEAANWQEKANARVTKLRAAGKHKEADELIRKTAEKIAKRIQEVNDQVYMGFDG